MRPPGSQAEWRIIERLLPSGWQEQARETGAFRRVRYTQSPGELLRLLLFHAVSDGGLRQTVTQARLAGLSEMSMVGLFKRFRSSRDWLAWIARELCGRLREEVRIPEGLRPRIFDSTTIQGPASRGTGWRLHYSLDLQTLGCDWYEITDAKGGELLERAPIEAGDVVLADRNYLRPQGVRVIRQAQGHVLIRLRWRHPALQNAQGQKVRALDWVTSLEVGQVGEWPAWLRDPGGRPIKGRVVAVKLPAPLAQRAEEKVLRRAAKEGKTADKRSLLAAHYVMTFTTLPAHQLKAPAVMELYRFRWQIELAFKRLKQILQLGKVPHKDPVAAQSWISAKLIVAFLLETLYRNAKTLSPWGYRLEV